MKCKDIPDKPILEFLYERAKENKTPCVLFNGYENSIGQSMPLNTPPKIITAKIVKLIKRKLVTGCSCGCRGDFTITTQGIDFLNNNKNKILK